MALVTGEEGALPSEYKLCPHSWLIPGETAVLLKSSSWKAKGTEQTQPLRTIRQTELEFESGQVAVWWNETSLRKRYRTSTKQYS